MASSSSAPSLSAALATPPTQKLTRSNFLFWQTLALPLIRGALAFGLLDGTEAAPAQTLEVEDSNNKKTTVPNPAYLAWVARDQAVLGFLINSLSPEVVAHVVGLTHAYEVWSVITKMFSTISRTRINHLRGTLNTTKKKGLTTAHYFAKMHEISSELAAAGKPIEEDEMIGYALNGLDSSYNDLVSSVNGNPLTMFDELYSLINAHDLRRDMLAEDEQEPPFISSANAADRRGHDDRPRGNRGWSPDRQGNRNYRGHSPDHGDRGDRGDRGDSRGYRYGRRDGGQNRRYDDDGGQRRRYDDDEGQHRRYDDGG
jgi:hypothetical protein